MAVNTGERMEAMDSGDTDEDIRRVHREFIARAVEQARAGNYGLADPGSPDISPEDLIGPYDGEEGPEDVEPGHVKDVPEEAPAADERPEPRRAAKPQAKLRKPPKPRTRRDRDARDMGRSALEKPFPFGIREE